MAETEAYRIPTIYLMDEDDAALRNVPLVSLLGRLRAELGRIPEHERDNAMVSIGSPGSGAQLVIEDKRGK